MPRHPFYNTKTWKHLRKVKLTTDPLCEDCKAKLATDVHHIKSINSGGSKTDYSNLRSECHECHSRRTLAERLGRDDIRIKGAAADGQPLDPNHWWNKKRNEQ